MADGKIIIDTKIDASGAEKGVKGLGNKLGSMAKGELNLFTKGIGAASVVLGKLGAYVLKGGFDFKKGMSKVKAVSGPTGKEIIVLKSALERLGIQLYESVDNPLKDIVKSANGMIETLSKAFKEGGFTALTESIGNVLSQIIVGIAESAPKIIDSSIVIIRAFVTGIQNNLPQIVNAGTKIVNALIEGAIQLLPQIAKLGIDITETLLKNLFGSKVSNAFRAFVDEAKKCFEDIKGAVESAVSVMVNVLGNLIKILSDLGRVILPIVSKAIEILCNNLTIILPLIAAVYAGFKAYTILTGLITTMTTAWKGATAALAVHEAASRLTLVALNGALPVSTMLVGVLTGKIKLATAAQAAWKAVMAISPIVLVTTAIAALTAGFVAYKLTQKDVISGEERLKNANEALGQSYTKIGESASGFYEGIKSAGGILNGFNESIIVSGEEQQKLSTRMDIVQSEITSIARTATNERRELTGNEIQRLDELFAEMQKLTERELEVQQAYQGAVKDRAQILADTHTGSLEEYQGYSQKLINSAMQTKDQVIDKADEQYTEEIALLGAKYDAMGQKGSEAYMQEVENANNKYTSAVDAANKECGDTLSIMTNGYADRTQALGDFTVKHDELKAQEELSNATYNSALEEEEKRHNSSIDLTYSEKVYENKRHKDALKGIEETHNMELAGLREQEQSNLSADVIKQGGILLEMSANTELYGGQITDKTKSMCDGIIDNMDNLPDDAKYSMKKAMEPMLSEMNSAEPGLFGKATNIAEGILTRLKRSFDIHSPSRKTRAIFKHVMEGAEIGMDEETDSLYSQTDDIADGVLKRFNATQIDVSSLANKMSATVNHEVAFANSSIVARNNQGTSTDATTLADTKDGDVFIVKNYMDSEEISEYTYKKVDGKFALAGKRVR